jgi:tetratricopeptide (TPR) repeat protein
VDETLYRFLKYVAIAIAAVVVGVMIWDSFFVEKIPGNTAYQQGNTLFEDGEYEQALRQYDNALVKQPEAPHYVRAKARTLMQLGRNDEALAWFDRAVLLQPYFGGAYANRGILYDRVGRYELAIADYEKALQLDEAVAEGPHWLTRFLRNQPEQPPTIRQRAEYLKQELAKPADQRVLRVPEVDAKQRTYKQ